MTCSCVPCGCAAAHVVRLTQTQSSVASHVSSQGAAAPRSEGRAVAASDFGKLSFAEQFRGAHTHGKDKKDKGSGGMSAKSPDSNHDGRVIASLCLGLGSSVKTTV